MATINNNVMTFSGTLQHKRALSSVLAQSDYVPAAGEIIGATDTGEVKFGDGTHTWSELPSYDGTLIEDTYSSTSATSGLSAAKGKDLNDRLAAFEAMTGIDCGEITVNGD